MTATKPTMMTATTLVTTAEAAAEAAAEEEEAAAVELLAAAPEVAHEVLDLISAEEMAHRMRGVAEPEAACARLQAALGRLRGLLATPAAYHVALLQRAGPRHAPADWSYGIWLMAPSALLGPVVAACRAVVLASATLAPLEAVAAELLGGFLTLTLTLTLTPTLTLTLTLSLTLTLTLTLTLP